MLRWHDLCFSLCYSELNSVESLAGLPRCGCAQVPAALCRVIGALYGQIASVMPKKKKSRGALLFQWCCHWVAPDRKMKWRRYCLFLDFQLRKRKKMAAAARGTPRYVSMFQLSCTSKSDRSAKMRSNK